MKKFKYSLNRLLNMRLRLEKESSQKFNNVSTKIKIIEDNIKHLNDLYKKNNFATCSTKIDELIKSNYAQYLENSIAFNKNEKEKIQKEYDSCLEDYKTKKKNRAILEKLRDKEYEKFLEEEDKQEQDFLDEVSLNMYYKEFEEDNLYEFEDN